MPESRLALVTGGAKRVGRAIVETLAGHGFDVAFTYLSSEDQAKALQARVELLGRKCVAIRADLTNPSAGVAGIVDALDPLGRLDVLVNNASIYHPGTLQSAGLEDARMMWAVHVEAPLLLCRQFESRLRAAKGRVINMADLLVERPWPQYMTYSATKAALANLTLSLARALAPEVTVNSIAPGVVEWPEGYPDAEKEKYLKRVPLGRAGSPADVAEAVLFLATTGSYLTGQTLRLDGGRSIT